jgi:hypothetical protein
MLNSKQTKWEVIEPWPGKSLMYHIYPDNGELGNTAICSASVKEHAYLIVNAVNSYEAMREALCTIANLPDNIACPSVKHKANEALKLSK